jgi:hypothetical protein
VSSRRRFAHAMSFISYDEARRSAIVAGERDA